MLHEIWKPIPYECRYSDYMKNTQAAFRFCIEDDAPIATLEAVLAIVRRLDIELRSLRTHAIAAGLEVQLRLAATDEDGLTLCRMRLNNVVGVLAVRVLPVVATKLAVPMTGACTSIPPYNSAHLHKQDFV